VKLYRKPCNISKLQQVVKIPVLRLNEMSMFQKSVINKYLANIDQAQIKTAYQAFKSNYSSAKIEQIKRMKEEEYQDGFLRDLFVKSLGYTLKPDENFNLVREFKNQTDGKKADAQIFKN